MKSEKGVAMKGSIRALVGFLIVYGAVGSLDADPQASILAMGALATAGLALMASGVNAMGKL
jgi:hypothetical protein